MCGVLNYYNTRLLIAKVDISLGLTLLNNGTILVVEGLQTFSGCSIVKSLISINSSFKKMNAKEAVNEQMFMRHVICFAIFLLANLLRFACYVAFSIDPEYSGSIWKLNLVAAIIWLYGLFFSQLTLCSIFWELSKKE